ncbi:MAG: 3-keto-5-aminohexanoate cleavage protein [Nitrososphaerota archaeon]|nr:3-keto-5-aminohexanoate cleavage protein [Nitrososphaerota archaeon]
MKVPRPKLGLWKLAAEEMKEYKFLAPLTELPPWDVPDKVVIKVAVSGRTAVPGFTGEEGFPSSIEQFIKASSEVIEAGAPSVALDFTWVRDSSGKRLDIDYKPVDAYRMVLDPLRRKFGRRFVADLNVLNGETFDDNMAPVREGLAEVALCASGHPKEFVQAAIDEVQENGARPSVVIHSPGEVYLAKKWLIDTGILEKPFCFEILFGLPFDSGRTLLSGSYVTNFKDMVTFLMYIVDQLYRLDREAVIQVDIAGRMSSFETAVSLMMGLHIRVGTEDTIWRFPHKNEIVKGNLQIFNDAKQLAALLGRDIADAEHYRKILQIAGPR